MAATHSHIAIRQRHAETCKLVISRVYDGEMLTHVLKTLGMSAQSFYETLESAPELADSYRRAKSALAERFANEIVDIADNEMDHNRARNRIAARQWYASKVRPSEYGDRMDINVTQTIDIGSALADARRRVSLPQCDQQPVIEAQAVDFIEVVDDQPTDTQSDDIVEATEFKPANPIRKTYSKPKKGAPKIKAGPGGGAPQE